MSFDQDPNEQANISGADLAQMIDHIKQLEQQLSAMTQAKEKAEADRDTAETAWRVEKERAESAEQRIREAQEQEPVAWLAEEEHSDIV